MEGGWTPYPPSPAVQLSDIPCHKTYAMALAGAVEIGWKVDESVARDGVSLYPPGSAVQLSRFYDLTSNPTGPRLAVLRSGDQTH